MSKPITKEYLIENLKSFESQLLSQKYVSNSQLSSLEASIEEMISSLSSKNVQIAKIEPIIGGNKITFLYYDESNEPHTETLEVMNGEKGTSVTNASIGAGNILSLVLSDGQVIEAGKIIIDSNELVLEDYYTKGQSDERYVQKMELNTLIGSYLDLNFKKIESEDIQNIFKEE